MDGSPSFLGNRRGSQKCRGRGTENEYSKRFLCTYSIYWILFLAINKKWYLLQMLTWCFWDWIFVILIKMRCENCLHYEGPWLQNRKNNNNNSSKTTNKQTRTKTKQKAKTKLTKTRTRTKKEKARKTKYRIKSSGRMMHSFWIRKALALIQRCIGSRRAKSYEKKS